MYILIDLASHEIVDWDDDHGELMQRAVDYSRTTNPCQIERVY